MLKCFSTTFFIGTWQVFWQSKITDWGNSQKLLQTCQTIKLQIINHKVRPPYATCTKPIIIHSHADYYNISQCPLSHQVYFHTIKFSAILGNVGGHLMHFLGGKCRIQLISVYYAFGSWEEANSTISRFSFFFQGPWYF